MANVDAPRGATVIGSKGGTYNGRLDRMYIPDTDNVVMGIGDIVTLGGSADSRGVPSIVQATAGSTPVGIIVAFEYNPDNLTEQYRPASQERYAFVNTDPNVIFKLQEDSEGGALTAADFGLNADIIVGPVSTVSGLSGMELQSSSALGTSTLVLNINSLFNAEDNEIGVNANIVCSFNVHQYKSVGVAGV